MTTNSPDPDLPDPAELADDQDQESWDRDRDGRMADHAATDDAVETVDYDPVAGGSLTGPDGPELPPTLREPLEQDPAHRQEIREDIAERCGDAETPADVQAAREGDEG